MQRDLDPRSVSDRMIRTETDWDVIAGWTDEKYMRFDVRPVGRGVRPASSMFAVQIGEMTMTRFSYGVEVALTDFDDEAGNILVLTTLRGRTRHGIGREPDVELTTGQTYVADCSRSDYRFGADLDHLQLNLTVPHRLLADLALRWWGRVPDDSLWSNGGIIGGSDSAWLQLLRYATRTAAVAPEQVSGGRIGENLQEMLAAQLIADWARRARVDLDAGSGVAAPAYVRAAVQYIEENLQDLPTVAEIAAAAGVSARSLSGAFTRYLGMTVRSYLTEQRLQRVYRELRTSASSVTVSANNWGYVNLGVFAAAFRKRLGENPSDTLARACR